MKPTNHTIEDRIGDCGSKSLTLEEMDILCRKCHHLHDEEVVLIIGRLLGVIKDFFSQKKMDDNASPSK